jgi:hypothetical protein
MRIGTLSGLRDFRLSITRYLLVLHQKALADAELLEKKEQKIMLLEDVPEEKIEEVE